MVLRNVFYFENLNLRLPMVKNSTLFYLVDDINLSSDIILSPSIYNSLWDEEIDYLLDLLAYDPGTELVAKTLQRVDI